LERLNIELRADIIFSLGPLPDPIDGAPPSSFQSLAQLGVAPDFGFSAVATFVLRHPIDEWQSVEQPKIAINRLVGDPSKLSLQMALQKPGPNIRGLQSVFIGADAVTIIPDRAVAELDIRLVKEAIGQQMLELLREHVRRLGYHLVDGGPDDATQAAHTRIAKLISTRRMASAPFRTPAPLPEARHVTEALGRRLGEAPVRIRSLGTVPASRFMKELGTPAMVVPIVNFDNNQHALNENTWLGNLFRGVVIHSMTLRM
jgi:acetylornithine deacetylase/succinyl-diaminopimelate desuccinylase-like protein